MKDVEKHEPAPARLPSRPEIARVGLHGTDSGGHQRRKGRSRGAGRGAGTVVCFAFAWGGTDEHTLEGRDGGRVQWRRDETGTDHPFSVG